MTDERKQEIAALIAERFDIDPDEETGEYDLSDYEWTSGCYHGNKWLSLAEVVNMIDSFDYELYEIFSEDEDY